MTRPSHIEGVRKIFFPAQLTWCLPFLHQISSVLSQLLYTLRTAQDHTLLSLSKPSQALPDFIHCHNWLSNSSLSFFSFCLGFKSRGVLAFTNPYQGPGAPPLVTPTEASSREEVHSGFQCCGCTSSCQPRALTLRGGDALWGGRQTQHLQLPSPRLHAQLGCWGTAHTAETCSLKVQEKPSPESSYQPVTRTFILPEE